MQELCLPELAIARGVHSLAVRSAMADVLDLRHRLPLIWEHLQTGGGEIWVARKVAAMSRHLDRFEVNVVDAGVADALAGESPSRVLRIAQAKVIEADQVGYRERLETELRKRYVGLSRTDEHGLRHVIARVEAGDAAWIDAMVDRVADALAQRRDLIPDVPAEATKSELRSVAFGWLAHPERVVELLGDAPARDFSRPTAILYVHLHQAALEGGWTGVARCEGLGPLLLEQVRRLLGHARVVLKPVIDLNSGSSVNAYEFPEAVKERTHLRCPGEVFPHASRMSRHVDLDHPFSFNRHGPPGQTGDHNVAPLGRTHHRAKTHLGYHLRQVGPDDYVWSTPHGQHRHVDGRGTHEIDELQAFELTHPGAIDASLDRLMVRLLPV